MGRAKRSSFGIRHARCARSSTQFRTITCYVCSHPSTQKQTLKIVSRSVLYTADDAKNRRGLWLIKPRLACTDEVIEKSTDFRSWPILLQKSVETGHEA